MEVFVWFSLSNKTYWGFFDNLLQAMPRSRNLKNKSLKNKCKVGLKKSKVELKNKSKLELKIKQKFIKNWSKV